MKNKKDFLYIFGLFFLVSSIILDRFNLIRALLLLLGLILVITRIIISKRKLFTKVIVPILLIIIIYIIDFNLFVYLNKVPILVIEYKSSDTVSTYNSLFYRIYNCSDELILDEYYEQNYLCQSENLDEININNFILEPIESFKEYKNSFVKLTGKVSKTLGESIIELNYYTENSDNINGYVEFDESKKVKVFFNNSINLSNYYIYDYITVIGNVHKLEDNDGNFIIHLKDSIIVPNDLYSSYEIITTDANICNINQYVEPNIYTYCLDNIRVKYNTDIIYDLSYVLTDKRLRIEELINVDVILYENNSFYELSNFNVQVCLNKDIYLVSKNIGINNELCESLVDSNE